MLLTVRLILYAITALNCFALAFRLMPVKNALARMFSALLIAVAVNAIVFMSLRLYLHLGGSSTVTGYTLVLLFNTILMAFVSVALLVTFYRETRNGRYS